MASLIAFVNALGQILQVVAWPTAVIVALVILRKPLQGFIDRLTKVAGPGFEAHAEELREKVRAATEESPQFHRTDDGHADTCAASDDVDSEILDESSRATISDTGDSRWDQADLYIQWSANRVAKAESVRSRAADYLLEGRPLSGVKLLRDEIEGWIFRAARVMEDGPSSITTLREAIGRLKHLNILNESQAIAVADFADTSDRLLVDNERAQMVSVTAVVESGGKLLKMVVKALATLAVYEGAVALYKDDLLRHVAGYSPQARFVDSDLDRMLPEYFYVRNLHIGYEQPGSIWELQFWLPDPIFNPDFYVETEDATAPKLCKSYLTAEFVTLGSIRAT